MKLPVLRWWRRWRGRLFIKKLARMLQQFDDRLKNADFSRHERRRIKHSILKDIKAAIEVFEKWEV